MMEMREELATKNKLLTQITEEARKYETYIENLNNDSKKYLEYVETNDFDLSQPIDIVMKKLEEEFYNIPNVF